MDEEEGITRLIDVTQEFANPELINDNYDTCPSRTIRKEISIYSKTSAWRICKEIGVNKLRQECKHFNDWLAKIESVAE